MMLLCYLAQNGKESTTEIFQKWDFYEKNFGHFLLLFFSIFFQKLSKSKGH